MREEPKKPSTVKLFIQLGIGLMMFFLFLDDAVTALSAGEFWTGSRKGGPTYHHSLAEDPVPSYGLIALWLALGVGCVVAAVMDLRKHFNE